MKLFLLSVFTAFSCSANALAQAPHPPFMNVVTLDASATAEVPTDTLTVTLYTEEQGPDAGQLAAKANARLEEALAKAKAQPRIEAHTGNYQTNAVYDRANQVTGWRLRADLILESRDFKAVAALAGSLQPTLKLGSMVFSLSREAREKTEATLTTEALARYQERARAVAKALGFQNYTLGQIVIRNEGQFPPPITYRSAAPMAISESASPPPVPVEGGKNSVTVVVSGSVILGPPK